MAQFISVVDILGAKIYIWLGLLYAIEANIKSTKWFVYYLEKSTNNFKSSLETDIEYVDILTGENK